MPSRASTTRSSLRTPRNGGACTPGTLHRWACREVCVCVGMAAPFVASGLLAAIPQCSHHITPAVCRQGRSGPLRLTHACSGRRAPASRTTSATLHPQTCIQHFHYTALRCKLIPISLAICQVLPRRDGRLPGSCRRQPHAQQPPDGSDHWGGARHAQRHAHALRERGETRGRGGCMWVLAGRRQRAASAAQMAHSAMPMQL